MTELGTVVYAAANLVIAIMLGCMLQSAWENSSNSFRLAASLLAAAAIGAVLVSDTIQRQDVIDLLELAKSVLLAAVLVMMRVRQVKAGQGLHSKQRATAGCSGAGAGERGSEATLPPSLRLALRGFLTPRQKR